MDSQSTSAARAYFSARPIVGVLPIEAASLFGWKMNPQGTRPGAFIVYAVCGQVQIGNQLSN